jgi:hypothetical protein
MRSSVDGAISLHHSQRAASVGLCPAAAVLIQVGPFYGVAYAAQAEARWSDPGGGE